MTHTVREIPEKSDHPKVKSFSFSWWLEFNVSNWFDTFMLFFLKFFFFLTVQMMLNPVCSECGTSPASCMNSALGSTRTTDEWKPFVCKLVWILFDSALMTGHVNLAVALFNCSYADKSWLSVIKSNNNSPTGAKRRRLLKWNWRANLWCENKSKVKM